MLKYEKHCMIILIIATEVKTAPGKTPIIFLDKQIHTKLDRKRQNLQVQALDNARAQSILFCLFPLCETVAY